MLFSRKLSKFLSFLFFIVFEKNSIKQKVLCSGEQRKLKKIKVKEKKTPKAMVLWNFFFVLTRTNERKTFLCLLGNFYHWRKIKYFLFLWNSFSQIPKKKRCLIYRVDGMILKKWKKVNSNMFCMIQKMRIKKSFKICKGAQKNAWQIRICIEGLTCHFIFGRWKILK